MFANKGRCWTPYIRKHLLQRNSGNTGRHMIWQVVTISKLTSITHIWVYFWRMRKLVLPKNLLHHKGRWMS
jgi:hypothetical protein